MTTDTTQKDEIFERQARLLDHYMDCIAFEEDSGDPEFDNRDVKETAARFIARRLHSIATDPIKRYRVEIRGCEFFELTIYTVEVDAANPGEAVVNALAKAKDESAGLFSPMLIVQMDEV